MSKAQPRQTCKSCGALWRKGARFCASCGRARASVRRGAQREAFAQVQQERLRTKREGWSLAAGFGLTLAGLLAASRLAEPRDWSEGQLLGAQAGFQILAACVAVALQGRGALRKSLGSVPGVNWLLASPLVGAGALFVSLAYLRLLFGPIESAERMSLALILFAVLGAPLLEEWLDRGVLWNAAERASGPLTALFATSALFAISHGLNGGGFFEFPHRFAGGLALGWLRWKSDSLVAPILAHMTWNGLAVLLFS